MKNLKNIIKNIGILLIVSSVFVLGIAKMAQAACTTHTNTFPTSLNAFVSNECIPSVWANSLEQLLGTWSTGTSTTIYQLLNGQASPTIRSSSSSVSQLTDFQGNKYSTSTGGGSGSISTSSPFTSGQIVVANGTSTINTTSSVFYLASNPSGFISTSTWNINASGTLIQIVNGGGSSTVGVNPFLSAYTNNAGFLTASTGVSSFNGLFGTVVGVGSLTTSTAGFTLTNSTGTLSLGIDFSVSPTWTGLHIFNNTSTFNATTKFASSTASKCARFDANQNLVSATGDCAAGDTTGAGGGGGTWSQVLSPRGLITFPTSSFPSLDRLALGNNQREVLSFDGVTQENVYFDIALPSYLGTVATATLSTFWTATSSNDVASTTAWNYGIRCVSDNGALEQAALQTASSTDTVLTALYAHKTSANGMPTSSVFAANELCTIKLFRDVANDTLNDDALWIRAILDLQW